MIREVGRLLHLKNPKTKPADFPKGVNMQERLFAMIYIIHLLARDMESAFASLHSLCRPHFIAISYQISR